MKHFSEMEEYFRPAKNGDVNAYNELYKAFIREGLVVFRNFCFNFLIYTIGEDDVTLMLSELFIKVMRNYRYCYGKFVNYAGVAIKRAVRQYCLRELVKPDDYVLSLDGPSEDGGTLIEEIPSYDYQSQATAISIQDTMMTMSSKSKSRNRMERRIGKIMLYRLNGYTYDEICKKMKITEGQLRFLIKKAKIDEDFTNLKIDLK